MFARYSNLNTLKYGCDPHTFNILSKDVFLLQTASTVFNLFTCTVKIVEQTWKRES